MNYSTAVILVNDNIRVVRGQYEESGKNTLFKTIDPDLKVNDFAVVESGTRWGITTVKITEINADPDYDSTVQVGWVLHKVDMARHEEIKTMEAGAIEIIKAGELRKRRHDIKQNTLDMYCAGELEKLDIMRLGAPALQAPLDGKTV